MKEKKAITLAILLILASLVPLFIIAEATPIDEHEETDGWVKGYVAHYDTSNITTFECMNTSASSITSVNFIYGPIWQSFHENVSVIKSIEASLRKFPGDVCYVRCGILDPNTMLYISYAEISFGSTGWRTFNLIDCFTEPNKEYYVYFELISGAGGIYTGGNSYANGTYKDYDKDLIIKINAIPNSEFINVTRTILDDIETNSISFNSTFYYNSSSGVVHLRIPISSFIKCIYNVNNTMINTSATSVSSINDIVNNTYYFDATNLFVYIGVNNITYGDPSWNITGGAGIEFSAMPPEYLEVGQYWQCQGLLINSTTGGIAKNVLTYTYIKYSNGSIAIGPIIYNCTDGNYLGIISTTSLTPGIYLVSVELNYTGFTYKFGYTLYLSIAPGPGIYSNAVLYINWFNTNFGLGLPEETLQLYINGIRMYRPTYYGYLGEIVNITIKDYYNFTLFTDIYTITTSQDFIDAGLTFHEYEFSNSNNEYYIISLKKDNATRWFERILSAYGNQELLIPTGNYTIRIYNADNSSYTSWTTIINASRGYEISGNDITLIIEGLDVIMGDMLDISYVFNGALIGDTKIISYNPPIILNIKGRAYVSDGVFKVCPPQIIRATTRNETFGNYINSTSLIPLNSSVISGSITILDDKIYFAGTNITWVNITYTDNATSMQNTTYMPNYVDLYGENVTINASGDLLATRVTRYHQLTMFYWIYNSVTGKFDVVININNTLSTPLYGVEVDVGFAKDKDNDGEQDSKPDMNTVKMYDIQNAYEELEELDNYFVDGTGIHFDFLSLNASASRSFKIEYYEDRNTIEGSRYNDEIVEVKSYIKNQIYPGTSDKYNKLSMQWSNIENTLFKGNLIVKISIDFETRIAGNSIKIYDTSRNKEVSSKYFTHTGNSIIISNAAFGTSLPGQVESFDIYFYVEDWGTIQPETYTMNTPIFGPISLFHILITLGISMMGISGVYVMANSNNLLKKKKLNAVMFIAIGLLILTMSVILQFRI